MIGKRDLDTEAGKAKFDEYCKSIERFIRSRIFSPADVEELAQETTTRVLQKLSADEDFRANAGYFINTAKYVLLEHYKDRETEIKRFGNFDNGDDDDDTARPIDAERQLADYASQKERAIFNDCLFECFEERSAEEQELLWRYSFDEKYRLDEEDSDAGRNLSDWLLDSIRAVRDKFLPLQDAHSPVTEEVRVKISRLRKAMRICAANCVSRKKGFG